MLTNDNLKRRFRWSLCCVFDIDIMVLVLFFSVGLLLIIPITISVAAFRWVLVAGSLRQQYHKPSTVLDGDRCSSGDLLYMVLLFYAIEKHLQCYDNSQNPADPWKLSISANTTGYQNKLDPTNQAIPFDIDVMLFPKVKCHDNVIMMIVDKVKCHDVGWWPIFPDAPKELFYSDLISGEAYDQLPRMCWHSSRGVQEMVRQTCEGWNEQDCKSKVDLIKKQKLSKWTRNDK